MILLDTDVLTHLYYNTEAVRDRANEVPLTRPILPTVISRAELLRGRMASLQTASTPAELVVAQQRLREAEAFLARYTQVAPIDARSAALFFRLRAMPRLRRTSRGDLLNAAIAVVHEATLVTRNVRDYEGVPNLDFTTW